ncbi:restriction endonuclease subunit S [Paraclostridium sordellii]|uniref:restriction endonuclease subunit S n=1 Tax=Paraclostridium sordellii TaxID=1505 RepID=UPI0005DB570C|nr:restriction endonuclease subunit S [Paeniclostridium sordellii]CEO08369.1 restriction endonuclease S subunit [[Clostridium] sordellii] [Paeniclostridium sordellii]CEP87184.1 restriction endonuclease S subunit [[Clostridium] sordellii] [Paeniclostridium sordellii]CEP99139.1 restriction endonuclease S subunit [[Clostridium] sordellii] [Paeniclostridium sordellii]
MKEGYKKTEVGVIPEDWKVCLLSDIAEINPKKEILENHENVSFLAMEQVSNSGRILNVYLREYEEVSKGYTPFKNNDVLLAKITPCFENGKRALVKNLNTKIGFGSTEFHVLRNLEQESIPEYLYYCISAHRFREHAQLNMTGSAGQKRVPTTFLKEYKLAVPPLEEQEKIADILSTVDGQIDDTEMLIEKCQGLKKGLMQRLLTKGIGHTEFKKTEVGEIPVDWEVKKLEDVSYITMGQSPSSDSYNDKGIGVPFFQGNSEFGNIYPTVKKWCSEPKKIAEPLDILISVRAPVGAVNINNDRACIGRGLASIRQSNKINYMYLYYVLSISQDILNSSAQGSTFTAINSKDLKNFKIAIPSLDEQLKIAQILLSLDNNIEDYKNKKEKLEELKKGLMQQLLTGKIRTSI